MKAKKFQDLIAKMSRERQQKIQEGIQRAKLAICTCPPAYETNDPTWELCLVHGLPIGEEDDGTTKGEGSS